MSNPENNLQWQAHCRGSSITSEGRLGVGTTFDDEARMLRWRIVSTWKITEYEVNRKVSFKSTSGPMRSKGGYTYESVDGGTKVTSIGEAQLRGLFKLAQPILAREAKKEWETSFVNLKELLEAA